MSEPLVLTSDQPPIRRPSVWLTGVALYILLISIGAGVGGELGIFTTASFNALPFVGLAILAYFAGSQFNWAWIATGLWLALVLGLAALYTFGLGVIPLLDLPPGGISPEQAPTLSPADVLSIVLLILGIFVALGIGLLTLLPPVRRGLAQVLPIDPDSFVHAVAVVTIVSITLMMFVPLLVAGEPPLLALINTVGGEEFSDLSADEQLRSQIYGLVWTIPAAFLAVGFGSRRNLACLLYTS
ncbi:MAG: CPBP family intramembrane metalloprotease, partial [Chloroflexus sp.]|nr:CPBP family intramembrane metalloprotease [Chloroflexus sp.]